MNKPIQSESKSKSKKHKVDPTKSSMLLEHPEKELKELSLRYQAILAAVPDIIMEVDADKVYAWANQAGLDFFGEDVLGKEASYYFEGEQNTYERVQPLFNDDENVIFVESWQRRRDGEKRLLAWWCRVLRDLEGNVKGAISTARDITEQTHTEEQVYLQNQLFLNTIESIPHPFYVIDSNTYRIVMANSATAVFGAISADSTCYALTHNRDKPCCGIKHKCPLVVVKKTKKPVTMEHIHYDKDGKPRCIELHGYPVFDKEGNVIQMIVYGLDISERKRVEEKLLESEERFRSVLQSAHDAIISIDGRGKITFWNEEAETMFGYPAREAIGKPVGIIIPERFRDRHQRGMQRVVSTGKSTIIGKIVELEGLRKDGSEFPLELSLAKNEKREGIFFTGILRDISERKREEVELVMANERMKSDLDAAAQVQKALLPKTYFEIFGVRCASAFRPCEELGGDIFNLFQLDETHIGIYILDVSGHGVPAALLSVTLSHLMSPQRGQSSILKQQTGGSPGYHLVPPSEVARQLNRQFPMDTNKLQYFTLVYGILNVDTYEFRYVIAGHPGPIYFSRDSETTILGQPGVPIGTFKDADYEEYSVSLKPGDRLYLYSDGITEVSNSKDELFGNKRLVGVLDQNRDKPLLDSIYSALKNVEEWCSWARLEDDISILAVEIAERVI